jgi:hypothetical protein
MCSSQKSEFYQRNEHIATTRVPLDVLGTDEAHIQADAEGNSLFWYGSEPPTGLPTPKDFIAAIRSGGLLRYAPPWAAIAISRHEQTAWICTDFLGLKHFFSRSEKTGIAVGPEALALAARGPSMIDPIAVYELFSRGNPQGGRTLFKEVDCIAPATIIKVTDTITRARYWRFPQLDPVDEATAIDMYSKAVRAASARHWRPGFRQELTAGRDSMMVLAALLSEGVNVRCWTHGTHESHDLLGAQERAIHFVVDHQPVYIEPLLAADPEEAASLAVWFLNASSGMANIGEYWHLPWVLRKLDSTGTVTGVGGEVFRGFYYQWAGRGVLPPALGRQLLIRGKIKEMMSFPNGILTRSIRSRGDRAVKADVPDTLRGDAYWHMLDGYYLTSRMHHFAGTTFSATGRLRKVVTPLFDPDVISCIAHVPIELRQWGSGLAAAVTKDCLSRIGKAALQTPLQDSKTSQLKRLARRVRQLRGTHFQGVASDVANLLFRSSAFRALARHDQLLTAGLYNPPVYERLMRRTSSAEDLPIFLGAIATVEWAARSIGSSYKGICDSESLPLDAPAAGRDHDI